MVKGLRIQKKREKELQKKAALLSKRNSKRLAKIEKRRVAKKNSLPQEGIPGAN